MKKELLRELPSVDEVIRSTAVRDECGSLSLATDSARAVLERMRREIALSERRSVSFDEVVSMVIGEVRSRLKPSIARVINATGTILHTNLGRAVLADEAIEAVGIAASGAVNIEFDLEKGERGERDGHVEWLICRLTGAEASCVVNNNAGAVLLVLNTLAEGREVVISRGELIEIGGSFRLPEIIKKSGCILKEVGTTNRTHPDDYISAISDRTALLFKAHKSNFDIVGFTKEVDRRGLVGIARSRGLPVVEDLGSGSMVDLSKYGIKKEPTVGESIRAGVDVATFSGDKLLGGPQAGIIAGKREYIDRIRKNPLKRALRVDKLTMAGLEATLRLYLTPETVHERVPVLRYLTRSVEEIETIAQKARHRLEGVLGDGYRVEVEDDVSQVGSGALPTCTIPTKVVTVSHPVIGPQSIFTRFIKNTPPILGRIQRDRFILDMRTIDDPEDVVPMQEG